MVEFYLEAPLQPFWRKTGATTATPVVVLIPPRANQIKVWTDVASLVATGTTVTAPSTSATNAVQTLTSNGTATGGTFTLTFLGQTTSALNYNSSAATIDTALEALSTIGTSGVVSAGGALPTSVTFTFSATTFAGTDIPTLLVDGRLLTGGADPSNSIKCSTTTTGANPYAYVEAGTESVFSANVGSSGKFPFIYIATVSGSGNYRISGYV